MPQPQPTPSVAAVVDRPRQPLITMDNLWMPSEFELMVCVCVSVVGVFHCVPRRAHWRCIVTVSHCTSIAIQAEDELITIVPKFRAQKLHFMSVRGAAATHTRPQPPR